jgi:hypothetical protein
MVLKTLLCRRSIAAAALSVMAIACGSLAVQAGALSDVGGALGNAAGGAARGVGGALGGSSGTSDGGAGGSVDSHAPGDGAEGNAGRSGNWIGAPSSASNDRRFQDQIDCSSTLIDWLRGQNCNGKSPEAASPDLDQASYSGGNDAVAPDLAAPSLAPAPVIPANPPVVARLTVEKPAVEKPKLAIAPPVMQPKASDKGQPQSSPTLSCGKAKTIIDGYGFTHVQSSDCDGQVFAFNATRDGKPFSVTLNALNGELIEVRKLPPTAAP